MASYETPAKSLEARTLVFDPKHYREVMWLAGSWPLTAGTVIDLDDRDRGVRGEAIVRSMRLIRHSDDELTICLNCDVDERWWAAHPLD